jgi:hypothetical protein
VGQAKDIAEWNGSAWVFTDGVQGDFLYNATTALTYIFRSGNWVQTTGIPALNNGNTISSGLRIGTNNSRSLTFETNNVNRGRFDSVGRFYVYDTSLRKSNKYLQIDSITGRLVASEISGGAGSSTLALDKISDAVDTNTINNGNFKQEWKWNSLANNTGLKLSSSAPGTGTNHVQKLFESQLTGAMFNTATTSWAGYFDNQQTVGFGNGIYARGGRAGEFVGDVIVSGALSANGILISQIDGNKSSEIKSASLQDFFIKSQGSRLLNGVSGCGWALTINRKSATEYVMGIGGMDYGSSNYRAEFTTATFIERSSDKLLFSTNSGLAGGYSPFSPTYQMSIVGSTSNVGIGTTSPVTSAALDITSTTKGFLPPRMTATQASAISSPAKGLLLFVTDTDGTFTSVGWWGYNGATWEKLNN